MRFRDFPKLISDHFHADLCITASPKKEGAHSGKSDSGFGLDKLGNMGILENLLATSLLLLQKVRCLPRGMKRGVEMLSGRESRLCPTFRVLLRSSKVWSVFSLVKLFSGG